MAVAVARRRKKDKKYFFLHFVAKRRIKLRSKMENGKKLTRIEGEKKGNKKI